MIIFTSICANYLHKARTLAASVKENIPDATFVVCLCEREIKPEWNDEAFDRVVLACDAWDGNFDRFIYKHAIVEASTAVKGQFFRFLYREYPNEESFVYLDPDIYVYSDFPELRQMLREHPIIVCPHLLVPGNIEMELSSTMHGVYNLGFLAVDHSKEAQSFIDWWAARLFQYCYDDIPHGIFTDQHWIDLAPCFFDVLVCRHHGYDFATWSIKGSVIKKRGDVYFVNGDPLRFIHFSGYGASAEHCMEQWLPDKTHLFYELYAEYGKKHNANNADHVSATPWSYACYRDGRPISNKLRVRYRQNEKVMNACDDPFALSDREIRRRLRRDHLPYPHQIAWAKARAIIKEGGMPLLFSRFKKKLLHK